jgi:hypothetical protein
MLASGRMQAFGGGRVVFGKNWSQACYGAFLVVVCGSATGALAQDGWPEVQFGSVDDCGAAPGITLYAYQSIDTGDKWNRYVLADTCFSAEGGWHVGAEVIEGLQADPAFTVLGVPTRFEVLADGERSHQRRGLTRSGILSADEEMPLPFPDVASITASVPWRLISGMPGAEELHAYGYSFATPRPDLDALPDGLYLVRPYGLIDSRLQGDDLVDVPYIEFREEVFLMRASGGAMEIVAGIAGEEPSFFDLRLEGGRLSGSFSLTERNETEAAWREPLEYETATLEIRWLSGQVVDAGGQIAVLGVGVGRTVLRGSDGAVETEDGWARLEILPVPEDVTTAELEGLFGRSLDGI